MHFLYPENRIRIKSAVFTGLNRDISLVRTGMKGPMNTRLMGLHRYRSKLKKTALPNNNILSRAFFYAVSLITATMEFIQLAFKMPRNVRFIYHPQR